MQPARWRRAGDALAARWSGAAGAWPAPSTGVIRGSWTMVHATRNPQAATGNPRPAAPSTHETQENPMSDHNQEKLTEDVLAAFATTPDARLRELMTALVKHVHAFAREVDLTPQEWLSGMKFLHAVGEISTERRPEFIMLSDTLGLSMMVVALEQARANAGAKNGENSGANDSAKGELPATEATVEGPFYWPDAPTLALGADIGAGLPGEPSLYQGRVTDLQGRPLAGALIDAWSADGDGKYDVQLSAEPTMRARGRFRTDAQGGYRFWSLYPICYPIPDDGPVGQMIHATHRSIFRPGHLHMRVSAPGHVPLTTHLFVAGSPHLDEDPVFAKRDSLVVDFDRHPPGRAADGREMTTPYHSAVYDFRLAPAAT
jgi:hydroxyquinol 1,2-dioxygenase